MKASDASAQQPFPRRLRGLEAAEFTTLSSLDVYGGTGFLLRTGFTLRAVPAARVSDGFFRTLGVEPMLGRDFRSGEDRPGQPKIAILSYGTWMKRFGGRRDVIGESISLTGEAYTVVGYCPVVLPLRRVPARSSGCPCWTRMDARSEEAATTSTGWGGCAMA
jgi:hypothetical protein